MTTQYASFFLGSTCLGVDVLRVQELLPPQTMTPVPRAASEMRGLINLRGQIVPAIDLRLRLGMAEAPQAESQMNVVVRGDEGLVSLLVDRVGDVLEVAMDSFEPTPGSVRAEAARYTRGVHKLEQGLLIVLDVDSVCHGDPGG